MSLVLYGSESVETLTSWVHELFTEAKNLGIESPIFEGHPTGEDQIHTLCRVKPVRDLRYVEIVFPLPETMSHFKIKPINYFSHLVGHESEGSILSSLKKMGWGLGLSSYNGYGASGFDHFCVQIDLTESGFMNYEKVVQVVFDYLSLVKVEEWIWREMQSLSDVDFKFKEVEAQPANYVSRLAGDMHKYPSAHYVSGSRVSD
jgi:insulysin